MSCVAFIKTAHRKTSADSVEEAHWQMKENSNKEKKPNKAAAESQTKRESFITSEISINEIDIHCI